MRLITISKRYTPESIDVVVQFHKTFTNIHRSVCDILNDAGIKCEIDLLDTSKLVRFSGNAELINHVSETIVETVTKYLVAQDGICFESIAIRTKEQY